MRRDRSISRCLLGGSLTAIAFAVVISAQSAAQQLPPAVQPPADCKGDTKCLLEQYMKSKGVDKKSSTNDLAPLYVGPLPLTDEEKRKLGNESAGKKFDSIILQDLLREKGLAK
jgi:hypothetical protein